MFGNKVKVGPFDFTIEEWPLLRGMSAQRYGECSTVEFVIRIDGSHGLIKLMDTLMHEINHAIWFTYDIQDGDKEERIVGMIATAWTQVYRDNPWLLSYFMECIK